MRNINRINGLLRNCAVFARQARLPAVFVALWSIGAARAPAIGRQTA